MAHSKGMDCLIRKAIEKGIVTVKMKSKVFEKEMLMGHGKEKAIEKELQ
jgi:hypothetical protein